jgi:hypothetical protein
MSRLVAAPCGVPRAALCVLKHALAFTATEAIQIRQSVVRRAAAVAPNGGTIRERAADPAPPAGKLAPTPPRRRVMAGKPLLALSNRPNARRLVGWGKPDSVQRRQRSLPSESRPWGKSHVKTALSNLSGIGVLKHARACTADRSHPDPPIGGAMEAVWRIVCVYDLDPPAMNRAGSLSADLSE